MAIINQRVDYEVMWEAAEGLKTFERKKTTQSGYAIQMGDLTLPGSGPTKGVTRANIKGKAIRSSSLFNVAESSFRRRSSSEGRGSKGIIGVAHSYQTAQHYKDMDMFS